MYFCRAYWRGCAVIICGLGFKDSYCGQFSGHYLGSLPRPHNETRIALSLPGSFSPNRPVCRRSTVDTQIDVRLARMRLPLRSQHLVSNSTNSGTESSEISFRDTPLKFQNHLSKLHSDSANQHLAPLFDHPQPPESVARVLQTSLLQLIGKEYFPPPQPLKPSPSMITE